MLWLAHSTIAFPALSKAARRLTLAKCFLAGSRFAAASFAIPPLAMATLAVRGGQPQQVLVVWAASRLLKCLCLTRLERRGLLRQLLPVGRQLLLRRQRLSHRPLPRRLCLRALRRRRRRHLALQLLGELVSEPPLEPLLVGDLLLEPLLPQAHPLAQVRRRSLRAQPRRLARLLGHARLHRLARRQLRRRTLRRRRRLGARGLEPRGRLAPLEQPLLEPAHLGRVLRVGRHQLLDDALQPLDLALGGLQEARRARRRLRQRCRRALLCHRCRHRKRLRRPLRLSRAALCRRAQRVLRRLSPHARQLGSGLAQLRGRRALPRRCLLRRRLRRRLPGLGAPRLLR